jgi:hypothetical protein
MDWIGHAVFAGLHFCDVSSNLGYLPNNLGTDSVGLLSWTTKLVRNSCLSFSPQSLGRKEEIGCNKSGATFSTEPAKKLVLVLALLPRVQDRAKKEATRWSQFLLS